MPKNLPIGDKNINSTATANSKATTTGQPGTEMAFKVVLALILMN